MSDRDPNSGPDLSRLETRRRLSPSAMHELFVIAEKWRLPIEKVGELLEGIEHLTLEKMKTATGILGEDELTRISYLVGIYQTLQILLPADQANCWMTRPNDNLLFGGQTPLEYGIRNGVPGLEQIRSLLDAASGGQ